ncbi:hypothetical protein ANCCAN_13930 [Ancylostoma caninum]|uniref:SCP domain-containing protein n=1 Tax=Ancylostoma caninum TaxID=29170 RepID=A0A368GA34_ANCCA|nr:hypothetical protein ANCCAN_13930 [Ancylostoma caninum]
MMFSASLLLVVFCTIPMISASIELTRGLEEPCDKILKKFHIRMRTVACPTNIKAPLLKEIPKKTNVSLRENVNIVAFTMMFSASLLLVVFCMIPMISASMEPTHGLEEPCDKILRRFHLRMRTVACPTNIKAPLLKEIPKKTNVSLRYNCRLEEVANTILQFRERGLEKSSRMFPNAKITEHLVFRKGRDQYPPIEAEGASKFVEDAMQKWSVELEEMKTQDLSRFGCNFYDDKLGDNNYELCCVFN